MSLPAAQDAPISSLKWPLPMRLATLARVFAREFDGECSIAVFYCHGVTPFSAAAVVLLVLAVAFMMSFAVMSL